MVVLYKREGKREGKRGGKRERKIDMMYEIAFILTISFSKKRPTPPLLIKAMTMPLNDAAFFAQFSIDYVGIVSYISRSL